MLGAPEHAEVRKNVATRLLKASTTMTYQIANSLQAPIH